MTETSARITATSWSIDQNGILQLFPEGATRWDGDLYFEGIEILSTGLLEEVTGDLCVDHQPFASAPNLRKVDGSVDASSTSLTGFPLLEETGGYFDLMDAEAFTSAPNLRKIGGYGDFRGTAIIDLPLLEKIGSWIDATDVKTFSSAPKLRKIQSQADFGGTALTELPSYEGDLNKITPPTGTKAENTGVRFVPK